MCCGSKARGSRRARAGLYARGTRARARAHRVTRNAPLRGLVGGGCRGGRLGGGVGRRGAGGTNGNGGIKAGGGGLRLAVVNLVARHHLLNGRAQELVLPVVVHLHRALEQRRPDALSLRARRGRGLDGFMAYTAMGHVRGG
jgi:hypothetical protein